MFKALANFHSLSIYSIILAVLAQLMYPPLASAMSEAQKTIFQSGIYQFDLKVNADCSEEISMSGDSNTAIAFNYFVSQGLEPHQAAGIVGNLLGESGLIPNRKQGTGIQTISSIEPIKKDIADTSSNTGFGIAQWTDPGRQQSWLTFADKEGEDALSLGLELKYLMHELQTGDYGLDQLKKAQDLRQATWIILAFFEKPLVVIDANKDRDPVQPTSGLAKEALDTRERLAQTAASKGSASTSGTQSSADSSDAGCTDSSSNGTKFRIASFNLETTKGKPESFWKWRLGNSVNYANKNGFDIIGAQETETAQQFNAMKSKEFFGKDYDAYPAQDKGENQESGRPILYKRDRFEFVSGDRIAFPRMKKDFPGIRGNRTQPAYASVAYLRDKSSGQVFIIINTHNSAYPQYADERYESGIAYVNYIKNLKSKNLPIVFTGDFNEGFGVGEGTYQHKRENLNYCQLTENNLMVHAEDVLKGNKGACPQKGGGGIDNIYVSPDVEVKSYDLLPGGHSTSGSDHQHVAVADIVVPGENNNGATISSDGHAFPLRASRQTILGGSGSVWCYQKKANCHHDYNAADMFAPTGTAVLATMSGKVISAKDRDSSSVGSRVTIMGKDGILYYYAHMGEGTIKVRDGQSVSAGQQIGSVGTSTDAMGTDPHLHIDALPGNRFKYRPSCSGSGCSGYPFFNIQETMYNLFKLVK